MIDWEGREQLVAWVMGRQVSRGELDEAFKKVQPKDNWKNPINAEVVVEGDEEIAMIREAVIFFTGSVPSFKALRPVRPIRGKDGGAMLYKVVAAGYYVAIGA